MKLFNSVKQIADELKEKGVCNKNLLIGVDGFLDSGKTCLACNLKEILGADYISIIDVDKYYLQKGNSIIERIDFNKLKRDILNSQNKTSVIFSGVCLLQVLKTIGLSADIYIYVKRMAKPVNRCPDIWQDELDCTFTGSINVWENDAIALERKCDNQDCVMDIRKLLATRRDVVLYHQKYEPYKSAEYCYNRFEL